MVRFSHYIRHLFVPSEHNNYRAKTLHLNFLSSYLVIALILVLTTSSYSRKILGVATDITTQKLFELTNQQRAQYGLSQLVYNEKLADAARRKAANMFRQNYWAHYGPNGETPWTFIMNANYSYELAGENLARDFDVSSGVVSAWMNSKTHKDNILRPEYREIGFAVANGVLEGHETTLVVQMFGKPLKRSVPIQTAYATDNQNKSDVTDNIEPTSSPIVSPTQSPTILPTIPKEHKNTTFIAGSSTSRDGSGLIRFISIKSVSHNITFIIIVLLAIALIVDLYYAYRLNVLRISGKNIAHIILVSLAVVSILFLKQGSIL